MLDPCPFNSPDVEGARTRISREPTSENDLASRGYPDSRRRLAAIPLKTRFPLTREFSSGSQKGPRKGQKEILSPNLVSPSIENRLPTRLRLTLICPLIWNVTWKLQSVLRSWRIVIGYFVPFSGGRNLPQGIVGFCYNHSLRYAWAIHRRNTHTPRRRSNWFSGAGPHNRGLC